MEKEWLSPHTSCDWSGVRCDENEFVLEIKLVSKNLNGVIPYEIGQLNSIRLLDLHSNHIRKTIPDEIGELPHLGYLILYDNEMSGEVPMDVCMSRKLGTLQKLWMDCNKNDPYPVNCH